MWPQEPNEIDAFAVRLVGLLAVAGTIALSSVSAGLLVAWRHQMPGHPGGTLPVMTRGVPPNDLFEQALPERTGLPDRIQWVDRDRNLVALPPDDAADLFLKQGEGR